MVNEIYGKKIAMTQMFDEQGNISPVTLIDVEPVCLLEEIKHSKTVKVKIGCFSVNQKKIKKIKKPISGYFPIRRSGRIRRSIAGTNWRW